MVSDGLKKRKIPLRLMQQSSVAKPSKFLMDSIRILSFTVILKITTFAYTRKKDYTRSITNE